MGEPRRWELDASHPISTQLHGPKLRLGERVPVIEAVLTDELVEKVLDVLVSQIVYRYEDMDAGEQETFRHWWRPTAREALRAAGFVEPGGTDGH